MLGEYLENPALRFRFINPTATHLGAVLRLRSCALGADGGGQLVVVLRLLLVVLGVLLLACTLRSPTRASDELN
jgi:hypothetical protein